MEGQRKSIADIAHMTTISEEEAGEMMKDEATEEEAGEGYTDFGEADSDGTGADDAGDAEDKEYTQGVFAKKEEKPRMEHSEPAFTVTARPEAKEMFDFMMYHTYHNPAGLLSVLIGIGAIVALVFNLINKGGTMVTVLLGVIIVMFLANSPIAIWYRAKKQAELISDSANTITYTFSSVGLDMSRGSEYAAYDWSRIEKIIEVKDCYYFYLTQNSAFVLPKGNLAGNEAGFKGIIENCKAKKKKLLKDTE
ncbi:MAG: YcxB family protein [Lachnospiraceae bacterium]|nr:YcxB family protein [Lachnospiraceae bacterium]